MSTFSYLYGKPSVSGDLRSAMEDFRVYEQLPFTCTGEGEHLFIKIRKQGQNTTFVARQLAKYFGVKDKLVTYAGLKDRFAVTEQWFGVHLPGKQHDTLSDFATEGVEVIEHIRHNKKLRTGALQGNRFEIILRNVSDVNELIRRWHAVCEFGVPNYFGEQRFGIDGGNIARALQMFNGQKVKDKKKRGIYLSASRSLLFNHLVSERVVSGDFDHIRVGDVAMLAGTQSVFLVNEVDDTLEQRLNSKDIDLTAPMWGSGELMSTGETLEHEKKLCQKFSEHCQGLEQFGLKHERRRLRLSLTNGQIDKIDGDSAVKLSFSLPAGCFATTILRELINYNDLTQRAGNKKEV